MRKFKVMLAGRNLLLDINGVGRFGVFTVRFVEAIDEVIAAHTALEDFRCEPKGKDLHERLLNASDDPPIFEAVEVTEIAFFDRGAKPTGLAYYPEKPNDKYR